MLKNSHVSSCVRWRSNHHHNLHKPVWPDWAIFLKALAVHFYNKSSPNIWWHFWVILKNTFKVITAASTLWEFTEKNGRLVISTSGHTEVHHHHQNWESERETQILSSLSRNFKHGLTELSGLVQVAQNSLSLTLVIPICPYLFLVRNYPSRRERERERLFQSLSDARNERISESFVSVSRC